MTLATPFQSAVAFDRLMRLKPLNWRRAQNLVALHRGYHEALRRDSSEPQRAFPMSLSIEPTTSCNLRCPECPSGLRSFTRPTGMLNPAQFESLLNEIGPYLVYVNLYFQGEPYLHPEMDQLVELSKRHGVYTSTSTNAHFLSAKRAEAIVASGLDRLIISIDGTTQETYSAYRIGGQLEKVMEGTRHILQARSKQGRWTGPHVVWQFLVVGPNEHEIPEIKRLAREVGVDELVIKTAQIDAPDDNHPLLTKSPGLRRYDRQEGGTWTLRNPMKDECWRMWQGCVMTWDGKVVPCCFDKDAAHAMGTFGEETFNSIWFSERYQAFRRSIFQDRSSLEMCRNCSEGTEVYA